MNQDSLQVIQGTEAPLQVLNGVNFVQISSADEFPKICRTCLSNNEIQVLQGLKYEDVSIQDMLYMCTSIRVNETDCLPQNMCMSCIRELLQFYLFQEKCKQSEILLYSVVGKKEEAELKQIETDDVRSEKSEPTSDYTPTSLRTPYSQKHKRTKFNSQALFKCQQCPEHFSNRQDLQKHRKTTKHSEMRTHSCEVCQKQFTKSKLRQHMRAHTKEKPFKCHVCPQAFSMSGNLKRHVMTHTGERPHVCSDCGKGFIQAKSLEIHKKTHSECHTQTIKSTTPKFVCEHCGKGFKRLNPYNLHLRRHYSDAKVVSSTRNELVSTELREHICDTCKRAYKTKHLLKAHRLTHGEKMFLCSECGRGFVTKAAMQSHFKIHTGERPYTCNTCHKSFAHIGTFDAHVLIHSGRKPYTCDVCAKSFTQMSHLKYHMRTHSGERPYLCSFCGKSFALKGNLTVHVRTHTGETPYLCPVCGRGFYDSSSMKKHRRGHGEVHVPRRDGGVKE